VSRIEESCRFCTRPDPERVVMLTENFYVMLSLGPLVEGYALIVTRAHISCCGEIDSPLMGEFRQLQAIVSAAQEQLYGGSSLRYEHGRTGSCLHLSEAHCYHAHFHLVPTDCDMASRVAARYPVERFPSWPDFVATYQTKRTPYLLTQDDGALVVAFVAERVPRQYLRSLVAECIGAPELADWMAFPGYDVVRRGRLRLGPVIEEQARAKGISYQTVSAT
jgi:diadenosine tetraphosphate (Ap4A) HIT family hydrolase